MSSARGGQQAQQSINIDDIPIEQLAQIKKQLDEELEVLTNSFAALKTAEAKFKAAMGCLNGLGKPAENKAMLVPLTSSLYVPGKLSDVHNVLVDVGTGYYVEKSQREAKQFYNAKILDLSKKTDDLKAAVENKQSNRQLIVQAFARRQARQQAAAESQS